MTTQRNMTQNTTDFEEIRSRHLMATTQALSTLNSQHHKGNKKVSIWEKESKTMEEAYYNFLRKILSDTGIFAHVFGGCVRDSFLQNEKPKDFDVECESLQDLRQLRRKLSILEESGFLELVEEAEYENLFNTLSYIVHGLDGRKIDFTCQTSSISMIRTADFTCNILHHNLETQTIKIKSGFNLKIFDVMQDIINKRLRFIQQPPKMSEIVEMHLEDRRAYYKLYSRYIKMVKRGWKLVDEQKIDLHPYKIKEGEKNDVCPITMEPLSELQFVVKTSCGHIFDGEALFTALQEPRSHCPYCRSDVSGFLTE